MEVVMRWFLVLFFGVGSLFAEKEMQERSDGSGETEVYVQAPEVSTGRLIVYMNGASSNGIEESEEYLSWVGHWVEKGYHYVEVVLPGYGNSSGKKDFCGKRTMQAINEAIDEMQKRFSIEKTGVVAHGQGGLAAILLAAERSDLQCVASTNSFVNVVAHGRRNQKLIQDLKEKKYDIDVNNYKELKARSPLYKIPNINTPLLIMQKMPQKIMSSREMKAFGYAMARKNIPVTFITIPKKTPNDDNKFTYVETLTHFDRWVNQMME